MNLLIKLLTRLLVKNTNHSLSPRERQVLALMMQGYLNKQIAHELGISEQTVKNHITHIFLKLHVTNRVQAVMRAK